MALSTMVTPSICNSAVTALISWSASAPLTPLRSVILVHDEYQALENMVYATHADFNARLGVLQARVDTEPQRVYYTVTEAIDNLRCEFEMLSSNVNAILLKLQECARREELVDEMGGALDEFIEQFVTH